MSEDDHVHGASPLSLPWLEAFSSRLRSSFVNIGFFAAMLLLLPSIASQFTRSAVIIEPIAVPQVLIDRGMTPDVVANRVWDGLQGFAGEAQLARTTFTAIPDSQLVQFSLPDTGISIDSIFKQLRQFFGLRETRIAGEIICETADCAPSGQRLRLRVSGSDTQVVDLPAIGDRAEPDYFRDAAAGVFAILDPFVPVAAYAHAAPEAAVAKARHLALSGHADAKWAHNLLGDLARQSGDTQAAIAAYSAALALDPGFGTARLNLAEVQAGAGQSDAAETNLAEAEARGGDGKALFEARAVLALAQGNTSLAITHLLAAAGRDRLDAPLLARIGDLELQLGRRDDALAHLRDALALDPGQADALRLLGAAYRQSGDLAGAEAVYRNWADYLPVSIEAHLSLAQIQRDAGNLESAAASYGRAVALDPANIANVLERARIMLSLGRYAQAVDGLTPFADAEPPDADAMLLLAQVQDQAGRFPQAAQRYRQFLALVPQGAEADMARASLAAIKDEL